MLSLRGKLLAWGAHLYTALGLLCAAGAAAAILRGGDSVVQAFVWLALAMLIDCTDGWLARRVRVTELVPEFSGRSLDDITDFLNYTALPLLLIWRESLLPPGTEGWLVFALIASAYGFCQTNAKTDDGYFVGFPSYWNVVALYFYLLAPAPAIALAIVIVLALLTFVPSLYLYPSQGGSFLNRATTALGFLWGIAVSGILYFLTENPRMPLPGDLSLVVFLTLAYPVVYLVASWNLTLKRWLVPG